MWRKGEGDLLVAFDEVVLEDGRLVGDLEGPLLTMETFLLTWGVGLGHDLDLGLGLGGGWDERRKLRRSDWFTSHELRNRCSCDCCALENKPEYKNVNDMQVVWTLGE